MAPPPFHTISDIGAARAVPNIDKFFLAGY